MSFLESGTPDERWQRYWEWRAQFCIRHWGRHPEFSIERQSDEH